MIKEGALCPKSQSPTLKCYCPIESTVLEQPTQEEEGPFPHSLASWSSLPQHPLSAPPPFSLVTSGIQM